MTSAITQTSNDENSNLICALFARLVLPFCFSSSQHQLLHTRNNNKFQSSIRFRRLIQFRNTRARHSGGGGMPSFK